MDEDLLRTKIAEVDVERERWRQRLAVRPLVRNVLFLLCMAVNALFLWTIAWRIAYQQFSDLFASLFLGRVCPWVCWWARAPPW